MNSNKGGRLVLRGGQITLKAMGVVVLSLLGRSGVEELLPWSWGWPPLILSSSSYGDQIQRSLFLVSFAFFSHPFIKFKDKNMFFTARNKFVTAKKKKKCKPRKVEQNN
jgi:hypothetical protein